MAAIFNWANLFRAFTLGGFDGCHQETAGWAGLVEGFIPDSEFAIGVTIA